MAKHGQIISINTIKTKPPESVLVILEDISPVRFLNRLGVRVSEGGDNVNGPKPQKRLCC